MQPSAVPVLQLSHVQLVFQKIGHEVCCNTFLLTQASPNAVIVESPFRSGGFLIRVIHEQGIP